MSDAEISYATSASWAIGDQRVSSALIPYLPIDQSSILTGLEQISGTREDARRIMSERSLAFVFSVDGDGGTGDRSVAVLVNDFLALVPTAVALQLERDRIRVISERDVDEVEPVFFIPLSLIEEVTVAVQDRVSGRGPVINYGYTTNAGKRALVGGMLGGATGAIIGAASAARQSQGPMGWSTGHHEAHLVMQLRFREWYKPSGVIPVGYEPNTLSIDLSDPVNQFLSDPDLREVVDGVTRLVDDSTDFEPRCVVLAKAGLHGFDQLDVVEASKDLFKPDHEFRTRYLPYLRSEACQLPGLERWFLDPATAAELDEVESELTAERQRARDQSQRLNEQIASLQDGFGRMPFFSGKKNAAIRAEIDECNAQVEEVESLNDNRVATLLGRLGELDPTRTLSVSELCSMFAASLPEWAFAEYTAKKVTLLHDDDLLEQMLVRAIALFGPMPRVSVEPVIGLLAWTGPAARASVREVVDDALRGERIIREKGARVEALPAPFPSRELLYDPALMPENRDLTARWGLFAWQTLESMGLDFHASKVVAQALLARAVELEMATTGVDLDAAKERVGSELAREFNSARLAGTVPSERRCPLCAEMVSSEASKCKHCGSAIDPLQPVDTGALRRLMQGLLDKCFSAPAALVDE